MLSEKLVQETVKYLALKPWGEVNWLIQGIIKESQPKKEVSKKEVSKK